MLKKTITILSALLLGACAVSPLGRSQLSLISPSELTQMGIQSFAQIKQETPQETDPALNRYVKCVANHITQEVGGEWEVAVFRDDEPNAFALPGGKIGVHTGILKVAQNQHQLAAVVAHEVAHVLANHGGERASQELAVNVGLELAQSVADTRFQQYSPLAMAALGLGAQVGVLLPYSRVHETEADLYGMDLMAKAGFDPRESVNVWLNMSQQSQGEEQPLAFLSTHPTHAVRIEDLRSRIEQNMGSYQQALAAGKNPHCQ